MRTLLPTRTPAESCTASARVPAGCGSRPSTGSPAPIAFVESFVASSPPRTVSWVPSVNERFVRDGRGELPGHDRDLRCNRVRGRCSRPRRRWRCSCRAVAARSAATTRRQRSKGQQQRSRTMTNGETSFAPDLQIPGRPFLKGLGSHEREEMRRGEAFRRFVRLSDGRLWTEGAVPHDEPSSAARICAGGGCCPGTCHCGLGARSKLQPGSLPKGASDVIVGFAVPNESERARSWSPVPVAEES